MNEFLLLLKKHKQLAFSLLFCAIVVVGYSQENRTYDGTGNNLNNPMWGALQSDIERIAPQAFEDSISAPAFPDKPNPRTISNTIFKQDDNIASELKLSDFVWVFGQLIDHEVTLITPNPDDPYGIEVPVCDPLFDPDCFGGARIPLSRSAPKPGTGTGVDNPRNYRNAVTAWIDGSVIYGSTEKRASYLRSFEGGKLIMNENGLLPMNTEDKTFSSPYDRDAPHMDNANPYTTRVFMSGDVRTNENLNLTVMHTLFAREHNRVCEELESNHPDWPDEKLFQHARKIVSGKLQAIIYEEWLPTMGVEIPEYRGYDPSVNPNISLAFSAAAYRMGHTLVNSRILRMNDNCQPMPGGDMTLKNAFFNPKILLNQGKISPFLKGMSYQLQQEMDCKLRSDIRSFLFGPPEAGIGMDLAAINIQRAREEGLPGFNAIRKAYGLEKYNSFSEICPENPELTQKLGDLYDSVDDIDPWVGMLAEKHAEGAMFGETVQTIMAYQFRVLRDGDRFYYENDPSLTAEEKEMIRNTRMRDIVVENTDLKLMQENVFKAKPDCLYSNIPLEDKEIAMYAFPNPTSDYYNLAVNATKDGEARYRIVNSVGQVMTETTFQLAEGMNTFSLSLDSRFPAGVYTLVINKGYRTNSIQLTKVE